jgi:sugar lactone lactonase YvrE
MGLLRLALPVIALLALLPFIQANPANAAELIPYQKISEKNMVDVSFDSAGNLYESEDKGNVNVWPLADGTVFGHAVTAGTANTLFTLHDTPAIAFDGAGDLFVTDRYGTTGGGIYVLPVSSGTIFGVAVKAGKPAEVLSGINNPIGLAFDTTGNLYYATQSSIDVLPVTSGTLYGHQVIVDTPAVLASGLTEGGFLAFDNGSQPQDLFFTDVGNQAGGAASVNVLPGLTATIYGQQVTANTPTALFTGLTDASGVAMDTAGDLYVDRYGNVAVVSPTNRAIDGTSVSANTLSQLATGLSGDLGNTVYNGNVFVVDQNNKSIDELTTPTAAVTSVTFGGSPLNPLIMVQGAGFDTSPPTSPMCSSATGKDYKYGDLYLVDDTNGWSTGLPGNCVGLTVAKLKPGTAEFGLGSFYVKYGYALAPGDTYTLGIDGLTLTGTVVYTTSSLATITSVKPASGPSSGGTSVTIKGIGLAGTKWVFFGAVPTKHLTISNGSITCTTPPGVGVVPVIAVNISDQVSATAGVFTYTTATSSAP